jgi:hypothetical protein
MALPTGRRSGLGGTATLTAVQVTPDPGDLYDSVDIQGWTLTVNQGVLDANTKSDLAEVKQIHRIGASITITKMVASTDFCKTSLLGTVFTINLVTGDGTAVGGSAGEEVFEGDVVVTKVGYQSPDGMEAEDIECVTIDADWTLAA